MIAARFRTRLLEAGFGPFTGVPCSYLKDLILDLELRAPADWMVASSEGEAMGLAAGRALAGRRPVVLMQNDGYGNAVNPLSSLQLLYRLPALLLITWRAKPGQKDAPQHQLMGETLTALLDLFAIPHRTLSADEACLDQALRDAAAHMEAHGTPFALIVPKATFTGEPSAPAPAPDAAARRHDFIRALQPTLTPSDLVVATTGFTGREASELIGGDGLFYTAGSMGCAPGVALTLALERPRARVTVLDGDGALLMKLGTLATVGAAAPKNFRHVLFDNGMHESTGGQRTAAAGVDFSAVARACGYAGAEEASTLDGFRRWLGADAPGPRFLRVRVPAGTLEGLTRPEDPPVELRSRFTRRVESLR